MKTLFAGIVLILLIGFAGFFYRNVAERNALPPVACTMEAKICPNGESVGRTGPSCEFTACPLPNVEINDVQVSFVLPEGYVVDENALGAEPTLIAAFVKPSLSDSVPHTIMIRRYEIPAGESADDVILAHTRYQPADMQAEDFERFEPVLINGKTFRATVIERFEGQVESAYFLARATDVLRFTVVERDVTDWTNPDLVVSDLPEHQALLQMLATLQSP